MGRGNGGRGYSDRLEVKREDKGGRGGRKGQWRAREQWQGGRGNGERVYSDRKEVKKQGRGSR